MTDANKRELEALHGAINYATGYLDALAGWAREQDQRDSATFARMAIQDYLMAAAPREQVDLDWYKQGHVLEREEEQEAAAGGE